MPLLEVDRQRGAVVRVLHRAQREVHLTGRHRSLVARDALAQLRLEAALQVPAQCEQGRFPLPVGIGAREAAVVELVEEVQREVQVLLVHRLGTRRQLVEGQGQMLEQKAGDVAAWGGQREHEGALPVR